MVEKIPRYVTNLPETFYFSFTIVFTLNFSFSGISGNLFCISINFRILTLKRSILKFDPCFVLLWNCPFYQPQYAKNELIRREKKPGHDYYVTNIIQFIVENTLFFTPNPNFFFILFLFVIIECRKIAECIHVHVFADM